MNKPAAPRKGDIIVIIGALLLAALLWLVASVWRNSNGTQGFIAEIYTDGQLTHTIASTEGEQELLLENAAGYNVLQIGPQGARMLEASCRNQDCVRIGLQNQPGSVIACLPHRLLICLKGGREAEYDAITR